MKIKTSEIPEYLGLIFSTIFISGINIILSGHLLGYLLNLEDRSENSFRLRLPWMLDIKIQGDKVIAGFAAFSISLLLVGFKLSTIATTIFITNLEATDSQWTACQALATSISLTFCIIVGGIKFLFINIRLGIKDAAVTEMLDERVNKLIKK